MSNCTVSPVQALLAYRLLLDICWIHERCADWYPYNDAAGELSHVPARSICSLRRAADRHFITRNVGEVPVRRDRSRLVATSETRGGAEFASVQLDESVPRIMCLKVGIIEMLCL